MLDGPTFLNDYERDDALMQVEDAAKGIRAHLDAIEKLLGGLDYTEAYDRVEQSQNGEKPKGWGMLAHPEDLRDLIDIIRNGG